MTLKEEYRNRLDFLIDIQQWTKNNNSLSAGQRICISQERAAIMRCMDIINEDKKATPEPRYELPQHLEQKVQHLDMVKRREATLARQNYGFDTED